jgi:tetratricopeptide (TPR) repeat protein
MRLQILLCIGAAWVLGGCAAMGVVASSDPKVKLSDASYLFDKIDRPSPAESLIREAIEICQSKSDEACLAEGYRTYGFFFRSASIRGKWSNHFRKRGFLDKSATFDTRYAKSIEYFTKAREIYSHLESFGDLTNVDLNMGFTYELMGERGLACQSFDKAVEDNKETLRRDPSAKIALPEGVTSFEEYLVPHRKRVGCNGAA